MSTAYPDDALLDWLDAEVASLASTEEISFTSSYTEINGIKYRLVNLYIGNTIIPAGVDDNLRGAVCDALRHKEAGEARQQTEEPQLTPFRRFSP